MTAIQAALEGAAADNATRVIVIAAEGPAFCAGHDLKEMTRYRAAGDAGTGRLWPPCSPNARR